MASRKSFLSKQSYIFPETHFNQNSSPQEGGHMFEFDEAELWDTFNPDTKKGCRSGLKRASKKKMVDVGNRGMKSGPVDSTSLPVNIPDWSKILKEDYKEQRKWQSDDDDEDDEDAAAGDDENEGEGIRVPPHEFLARRRGASLSVHEGIGRTLKGRDLRSVRNAIWKKVGFED